MSQSEDQSQKTEQPSQRKLEKAKEKGDVFTSKEINSFLSLITLSLLTVLFGGFFMKLLALKMEPFISQPDRLISIINNNKGNSPGGDFTQVIGNLTFSILPFLIIPALIIMVVNVFSLLAQHGIVYSPEVIMPKLERISPLSGFKRIFSLKSVVELIKGLVKITIVGSIFYVILRSEINSFIYSNTISVIAGLSLLLNSITKLFIAVCCFMFFLSVADFLYQRSSYINKMKMSKKELKDENKEQEGSPEIKSKLKSMRAKMSKRRVMAAVPKADVVITNPTHYAVALEYKDGKHDVPIVVAKGQDNIALLIREIAQKNKIPIVENPPLARLLYSEVEIDRPIKEKHYKAVAEVIAYVMKLRRKPLATYR